VARLQGIWNAVFLAYDRQIIGRYDLYLEPVVTQVVGITLATLAFRVLIERDVSPTGNGLVVR
jgi:hypothetical protein